jgi:putative chitinase
MKFTKEDFEKLKIINPDLYIDWFNLYSEQFNVNTVKRILCFLPNLLHESTNFKYVKEILPRNKSDYVERLGNFFGRGLLQVTWKRNYKLFTEWCKLNIQEFDKDFVKNPELLETPQYAVLSAFWYWKSNNLQKYADINDFDNVCSLINRGKLIDKTNPNWKKLINGYDDRLKKYNLVKQMLKSWIQ